ncbi:MAG: ABC transporter substrate-binding protein [Candidatus Fimenecus sp.]
MKMKKVLAVLLAVTMVVLCFAACGKGNDATGEKTIKIGFSGPLTGDYAQYGNGVKNGAQLAIDEINEAGGINGYKLELNAQDDEGDQEKAVNAYNTLKDWGMQLSLGTVTSGACIAFQGVAKTDNVFVLTPSASAVPAIDGDNAFRVCFSDPNQGIASADYIADNKLATKVAVIYQTNDYSNGIYNKFVAEAKEKGLEIVTAQSFTADNNKDFSAQIQAVKSSGADLLFLPIYYSEATLILKQAKDAGLNVKFFGCDGLDGILTMENFDTSLAEGVMLLTPFAKDATDDYTVNFVTKYKAKYGEDTMNQFAADAYDAIYIIKAAAEKAGITADMTASETCDALKAAMTQITVDGVTGTGITWTADGEPSKAPKAVVIENGAYKAL